jgi:hypothetical protein
MSAKSYASTSTFTGRLSELRAVATDIEVVDLFFRTVPALREAIDAAMDAFFEERGM